METLDLTRKYRATDWVDFAGNEDIKNSITHILSTDNYRPQSILITGPTGNGKTTIARLIAKEYLCTNRDSNGFCGKCETCQDVDRYIKTGDTSILPNIHEINVAEQSGKYDLDTELEEMLIPSYNDEWKIYILDECHKASDALQNRLLKLMEEPPENVLFILCTNVPDRLLDTIKNRCRVHFEVKKPSYKDLGEIMKSVCKEEGWEVTRGGLDAIYDLSNGTVRSALNRLQQVGVEHGKITVETVSSIFNTLPNEYYFQFVRNLKEKNIIAYTSLVYTVKNQVSLEQFLVGLKNFLKKGIYATNGIELENLTKEQATYYKEFFSEFSLHELSYLLDKVLNLDKANLELNLLLMGYRGLSVKEGSSSEESSEKDIDLKADTSDELKEEDKNAKELYEKEQEAKFIRDFEIVNKPSEPITPSILTQLGATLVN